MRRIGQVRRELDSGAEIKVTDLDRRQLLLAHAQNILRLEVPVRDPLLVQKVQSRGDLLDDLRRVMLREAHMLLDPRQQRSTVDLRGGDGTKKKFIVWKRFSTKTYKFIRGKLTFSKTK